jgi:hypothetical protein
MAHAGNLFSDVTISNIKEKGRLKIFSRPAILTIYTLISGLQGTVDGSATSAFAILHRLFTPVGYGIHNHALWFYKKMFAIQPCIFVF